MVILDNGHIFQYNLPRTAAKLTRLHNKCVTRLHIYTGLQEIWARSDWGWFPLVVGTEATASDFSNRGTMTSKIRRKLWRHNLSLTVSSNHNGNWERQKNRDIPVWCNDGLNIYNTLRPHIKRNHIFLDLLRKDHCTMKTMKYCNFQKSELPTQLKIAFIETKPWQRFVLNFCSFLMSDRWTSTHDHIYTSIGSKEAVE